MASSSRRYIDLIVIHCSATPNGRPVTVQEIDAWHQARGFARDPALIGWNEPELKHIGYHYVVLSLGAVNMGRGIEERGAHARGHNWRSMGICMAGLDKFRVAQWRSLRALVTVLIARLAQRREPLTLPRDWPENSGQAIELAQQKRIHIRGHRDLSPDADGDGTVEPVEWLKTCPGFDVAAWLAGGMEPLAGHILEEGAK